MKKQFKILTLILALVFLFPYTVQANDNMIKIWVNGEYIYSDVDPFIENGRTMVPIRFVSEALGFKVEWNQKTSVATVYGSDNYKIDFNIGKSFFTKDNLIDPKSYIEMDTQSMLIDDRTFLPIRYVAEAFDIKVDWDSEFNTVVIGDGYISPSDINDFQEAIVTNINDGNNISVKINGANFLVRPIGVHIPEGKSADAKLFNQSIIYTRRLLEGQIIYLEKDDTNIDNSGNLLRYIWIERPLTNKPTDEEATKNMYNALILSEGLANLNQTYNNKLYANLFRELYINSKKSSII